MSMNPEITNGGYNTFRDMFASEYGVFDSVNYMLGIMNTFNTVYPTLYGIDLRKDYVKLDAPQKELVWFEHSGHSPWLNETERFVDETLRVFE